MSKITIEFINEELKKYNWRCISSEYKNLDTELCFECEEGHKIYSTWKKIRTKRECPRCKDNYLKDQTSKLRPKAKGIKRILALDQSTHVTGWSIYDNNKLVQYGTFVTNLKDEIARCSAIKTWLLSMINNWDLDCIGIEGIQLQDESSGAKMGVTVFQGLARLQGILMETCHSEKIDYIICPTNSWRHHCGVKGLKRTDRKRSMQMLAKQWHDITVSDDEADAIGIGKYVADQIKIEVTNWE